MPSDFHFKVPPDFSGLRVFCQPSLQEFYSFEALKTKLSDKPLQEVEELWLLAWKGGGPLRGPRMLLESSPAATLQVSNEVIRRSKLPAHCCFPCWRFHSLRPSSPLLRRQNSAQDSEGLAMPRRSRMKPQWVLHEQVPALSCLARPCMVLHGHWK